MTTAMKGRRVRWRIRRAEDLMAGVQRRFLYGEKAMLAQIWLKKGTTVPRHVHQAEQLSFIVEGALRLRLATIFRRSTRCVQARCWSSRRTCRTRRQQQGTETGTLKTRMASDSRIKPHHGMDGKAEGVA